MKKTVTVSIQVEVNEQIPDVVVSTVIGIVVESGKNSNQKLCENMVIGVPFVPITDD
jgi:hypothetical protein